ASLLNGLAQSAGILIAGRALQGLGGALLAPAVLAIITTTFADAKDRATALAIWSGIAAGGGAVGLLLGGILTDLASWRWVFFVNVPVGAALAIATARYVPGSRSDLGHRTFDLPGAAAATGGLLALSAADPPLQPVARRRRVPSVVGGNSNGRHRRPQTGPSPRRSHRAPDRTRARDRRHDGPRPPPRAWTLRVRSPHRPASHRPR